MPASLAPLRHRPFALFWSGQLLSSLGDWTFFIARTWWIYEQTGSTAAVAAVALAGQLPMVLLTLLGGTVADLLPRRQVQIASDLARAVVQWSAAALVARGAMSTEGLFVLSAVHGMMAAFARPAFRALVPELVPPPDRHAANALMGLMSTGSGLAGPVLGGVVMAAAGFTGALRIDAFTYLMAALLLWAAGATGLGERRVPAQHQPSPERRPGSLFSAAFDGWGAIRQTGPFVLVSLSAMAAINVTGQAPVVLLRPWLAERLAGPGWAAALLGWLHTAFAAGMVVGTSLLAALRPRHRGYAMYGAMLVTGGLMMAMGLATRVWLVLTCQFLIGAAVMVEGVLWEGFLQDRVPPDRLGRVAALDEVGRMVLYPAGLALVGSLAGGGHELAVLLAGGAATALIAALVLALPATGRAR